MPGFARNDAQIKTRMEIKIALTYEKNGEILQKEVLATFENEHDADTVFTEMMSKIKR